VVNLVRLTGTRLFIPDFNAAAPEAARIGLVLWDEDLLVENLTLKAALQKGALALWPERKHGDTVWRKLGEEV